MNANYDEMYQFVKSSLSGHDVEATSIREFPFRKRSEHIRRVFMWVKRLAVTEDLPVSFNMEAVLTAAIFHDSGYALNLDPEIPHAEKSVVLFENYAASNNFPVETWQFISYLIQNHSKKQLMYLQDTPAELVLLMEADILDESGALSIVWDCMEQGSGENQSYDRSYQCIQENSAKMLDENPMVTAGAREIWQRKQSLVKEFIDQMETDLCFSDQQP